MVDGLLALQAAYQKSAPTEQGPARPEQQHCGMAARLDKKIASGEKCGIIPEI
jgi:hypothetical protein